jgi:hypothetical protein
VDWYQSKTIGFELIVVLVVLAVGLSFGIGGQFHFCRRAERWLRGGGTGGVWGVVAKSLRTRHQLAAR